MLREVGLIEEDGEPAADGSTDPDDEPITLD